MKCTPELAVCEPNLEVGQWWFNAVDARFSGSGEGLRLLGLESDGASGQTSVLEDVSRALTVGVDPPFRSWLAGDDGDAPADDRRVVSVSGASGEPRRVMLRRVVTREQGGRVSEVHGVVMASTPALPSPVQTELLAAVSSLADAAVALVDSLGRTAWVSPAFTTLTGYTESDALGRTQDALLSAPNTSQAARDRLLEAARTRSPSDVDIIYQTRTGRQMWVTAKVRWVASLGAERHDVVPAGYAVISYLDVTELRISAQSVLLERRVAAVLLEKPSLQAAAPELVRAISETLDMPAVHLWSVESGSESLTHLATHVEFSVPGAADTYAELMRGLEYRPGLVPGVVGVGLPGLAWGTGTTQVLQHLWANSRRAEQALAVGVETMTAVPLIGTHGVIGILEVEGPVLYPGHDRLPGRLENIADRIALFAMKSVERMSFTTVFEQSPDAQLLVDERSVISSVNARAIELFGEVADLPLGTILEGPPSLNALSSGTANRDVMTIEGHGRALDGRRFAAETTIGSLRGLGPTRFIVAVRDLSERREIEAALAREQERVRLLESRQALLVRLVSELPVALLVVRSTGRVVMANEAASNLFGEESRSLDGRHAESLFEADTLPERWLAERGRRSALWVVRRDGVRVPVQTQVRGVGERADDDLLVAILERGGRSGRETVVESMSDLHPSAESMRTEGFCQLFDELRELVEGIAELSDSSSPPVGLITTGQDERIRVLLDRGKRLLGLSRELMSQGEGADDAATLHVEPLSLDVLCQSSLSTIRPRTTARRIRLAYDYDGSEPPLVGDAKRLRLALENLMSMAEQSTMDGGSVRLEAWSEQAADTVCVAIVVEAAGEVDTTTEGETDDGGRPETPSVSVDADSSVGLQRVRRIVSAHGGSLRVNFVPGLGGRFDVVLPLMTPPSCEDHVESRARQRVVDAVPATAPSSERSADDSTQLTPSHGLFDLLRELGLEVDVALPGQTMEELVLQRRPRILVIDQRSWKPSDSELGSSVSERPDLRSHADQVWERIYRQCGHCDADIVVLGPNGAVLRSQLHGTTVFQLGGPDSAHVVEALRTALSTPRDWVEAPRDVAVVVSGLDVVRTRVLLVDDTPDNVTHLRLYLNMHGFAVHVANSAEDAIEAVRVSTPDIVLMDVQLPDMDGLEAIRRIRNRPASRDTAIIAVTALAAPDDRRRCLDAGADDYVSKPVKLRDLLSKIHGLTRRGTARRAPLQEQA